VSSQLNEQSVSQALKESLAELTSVSTAQELRAVKGRLIGEASPISKLNAQIKELPNDQKANAGKLVGSARAELNAAFEAKEAELEAIERIQQLEAEIS
jgi:phenylalanyl-tRNA synthetase alpha chain